MRALGVTLAAVVAAVGGAVPSAALELPDTSISYSIDVTLDPATRGLAGRETVRWTNPGSAPVSSVPLHLYLNAFAHEQTTWMRSAPSGMFDVDDVLRVHDDPWGWNEPVSIRRDGVDLTWDAIAPDDGNPFDRSLVEVALDRPVAPGETLELDIEFEARLPVPMERTGGRDDFFFVAQWFPKIATYETAGVRGATEDRWNAHQFHGPTEFYAPFADYDVTIKVPEGWLVAATGAGGPEGDTTDGIVRHRYRQRAVHDFVFCAGSHLVDDVTTHDPAGPGGPVSVRIVTPAGTEGSVERWRGATRGSLDVMGEHVGPYPYATLTVVLPPYWAMPTTGMEYPTLITGMHGDPMWDNPLMSAFLYPELVIAHEFAHQYFYGLLASNEFEEAYMDEGFTQYWGDRIMQETYGQPFDLGSVLGRGVSSMGMDAAGLPRDRDLGQSVWSGDSYLARNGYKFAQFYFIPALTQATAERLFGLDTVDRVFAAYVERYAFRHPRFEDYLAVAREVGGEPFAAFVEEAYRSRRQPDYLVRTLETERWSSPRGRLVTPEGVVGPERDDEDVLAGLDPAALDAEGVVVAEVHDPGRSRDERGFIERRSFAIETTEPDEDWEPAEDEFHASRVRVEGPGWDHLPVDVTFRFADGVSIRDRWDGHADYRQYRFVRAAPLSEVLVDPERVNLLDPDPANNGRLRRPDDALTGDWSRWTAGAFQLVFEALGQWL